MATSNTDEQERIINELVKAGAVKVGRPGGDDTLVRQFCFNETGMEGLKESCSTQVLIDKFKAATNIDEQIDLVLEHQSRTKLLQLFAESDLSENEAKGLATIEGASDPKMKEIYLRRLRFLDDLLDFEAQQCKLEVALAALQIMKKGGMPFYQPESFGECPFCLEEMFEKVTNERCNSVPAAIHYPCCDNSCCWSCRKEVDQKMTQETRDALFEYLLMGERSLDLRKKHIQKMKMMSKCPFCREPAHCREKEITEKYQRKAEKGDVRAQCEYGRRVLDGIGVEADPVRGKKLLSEAANAGSTEAKSILIGEICNESPLSGPLPLKALEHGKSLASAGHPVGQCLLAVQAEKLRVQQCPVENVPPETRALLLLAAWQLHKDAVDLLCSTRECYGNMNSSDDVGEAHMQARLLFWHERQTKYGSPSLLYHAGLRVYGDGMLTEEASVTNALPRALYWARRELVEIERGRSDYGIRRYSAYFAELVKGNIRGMENLVSSRCMTCNAKPRRNLRLSFCNR